MKSKVWLLGSNGLVRVLKLLVKVRGFVDRASMLACHGKSKA